MRKSKFRPPGVIAARKPLLFNGPNSRDTYNLIEAVEHHLVFDPERLPSDVLK
jgi:hypothetical protein